MSAAANAGKNCWRGHCSIRNNKQKCELMRVKVIALELQNIPISRPIRRTVIFSLETSEKK